MVTFFRARQSLSDGGQTHDTASYIGAAATALLVRNTQAEMPLHQKCLRMRDERLY